MDREKVNLKIDDREDSKILAIFNRNNIREFMGKLKVDITVIKERMKIGDYVVNEKNVCIERKTLADFVGSIRSKRLYEQLLNMEENYINNYLIISGNIKDAAFDPYLKNYSVHEYIGAIASLMVKFNTKIIVVNNDTQLVKLVLKIVEKSYGSSIAFPIVRKPKTVEDVKLGMLICVPGLGENKAKEVLKLYKFKDIHALKKEQLTSIKGIGNKLSDTLIEVFS